MNCEPSASIAAGEETDSGHLLAEADGRPGPGLHKIWESFGKDFSLTDGIATSEFA